MIVLDGVSKKHLCVCLTLFLNLNCGKFLLFSQCEIYCFGNVQYFTHINDLIESDGKRLISKLQSVVSKRSSLWLFVAIRGSDVTVTNDIVAKSN